ncbi:MAG: penicillin-binding transpeptidase domain-containing protein [bacterium]
MVTRSYRERILVFIIIISLISFFLIIRLFYIQLVQSRKMTGLAKGEHTKILQIELARGTIFDCNLQELAMSIEVDSIYSQPNRIERPYKTAIQLSNILGMNPTTLYKKLTHNSSFVWLKRKVEKKQSQKIRELNIKGIDFLKEYKRFYPKNHLGAHLIGFVGLDNEGLEGIESIYDKYLKAGINRLVVLKDGEGRTILCPQNNPLVKKASNGNDIILTIDEIIQHHAEAELKNICEEQKAKSGSIIVMVPKTGEILAWAIYPFYNPNCFSQFPSHQYRNTIVTDIFEPGSTFKIFSAIALLKEGLIPSEKTYFCPGHIQIGNKTIHCHHPHGTQNLEGIIANSCNVGMAQCIHRLSDRKFYSHILEFGFNEPTKIGLSGEEKGLLPKPKDWSRLSKYTIAIGQGISVTPLQLIMAVGAIANNGVLMKPIVIKAIKTPQGKIIKEFKPTPVRQVVPLELIPQINKMLTKVVTDGTGESAQINGYEIAGKTATAQKVDANGKYSPDKFIASFIGYLPADDPKVIILVIVDEPKGTYWGGTIAAPTFKKVAKRIISYMGILPTKPLAEEQSQHKG